MLHACGVDERLMTDLLRIQRDRATWIGVDVNFGENVADTPGLIVSTS